MSNFAEQNASSEPIRAYVVLKGPEGAVTSGNTVSASNIEAYKATPDVQEGVRNWLQDLGFRVAQVSPLSISVEGSPEQFEAVFHGQLVKVEHPGLPSSYWSWFDPPRIPDDMKDDVDTVVLPKPMKFACTTTS